jgi:hypothetical protein
MRTVMRAARGCKDSSNHCTRHDSILALAPWSPPPHTALRSSRSRSRLAIERARDPAIDHRTLPVGRDPALLGTGDRRREAEQVAIGAGGSRPHTTL